MDFLGSIKPVHHGHAYIQDDQVRLQKLTLIYRQLAIFCLSADVQPRFFRQQSPDDGSDVLLIVSD
ncbi:MAG TPA: hypothetical protein VGF61_08720 [Candidatus Acidoferrum sp.]